MLIDDEACELIRSRVQYNAHDLGEFGKMIRVDYVMNILADVQLRQKLAADGVITPISPPAESAAPACQECGNPAWNHQPWCSQPPPPTDPYA